MPQLSLVCCFPIGMLDIPDEYNYNMAPRHLVDNVKKFYLSFPPNSQN